MVFDHIGLFVQDLEYGKTRLMGILPIEHWGDAFEDPLLHVRVCFGADQTGLRYELVAPFGSPNPVSGVLAARRNILNHVAYRVPDIIRTAQALRTRGAAIIAPPKPAVAFGGARVAFLMTPLDFVIEIIEDPKAPARP